MNKPQQLLQRLDDIGASIASTHKALALIGLGSVGVELDRLDDYSDLDFFVVVQDGYKAEFIANLDWLSRARPISFAFKNTPDGCKVLFDDDVYAEFAVFELRELEAATYTEGRIVWQDDTFAEQWRIPKKQPVPWKPESREWLIGEIVTCLYVGLCRYRRGEQLSAWRFVQGHAFTLLLDLIEFDQSDPTLDVFSKERRFEQRHPDWAARLAQMLAGYDRVVESAQEMLTYLDQHYAVDPNVERVISAMPAMNTLTSRLYVDEADLARLIEFLPIARPAEWVGDYPSATDLREMLCQPELRARTRLWFDQDDQLLACALVDAYHNLLFDYRPDANSPELEEAIMQWGMTCAGLPLDAVCREDDVERMAWLARCGFQSQALRTLRYIRSLSEPIPDPQLPAGFFIRPVAGLAEVEALVAVHRAAFGTDNMSVEERRAMMSGPDYLPELDLVAVAPHGQLAGFCVCGIPVAENAITGRSEGYTDPIGVHPNFQQQGLARALLLTGLCLLRERGLAYATLGTSSENVAMQAAARSTGFPLQSAKVWFTKSC